MYSETVLHLQLWRVIASKRSTGELFNWFTHTAIQQFGTQIAQVWTCPGEPTHEPHLELLAFAEDRAYPRNLTGSKQTLAVVEHMLQQQYDIPLQSVLNVFPTHLATLLQRYGINFCAGCGIREDLYLSSLESPQHADLADTPQKLGIFIFLRRPPQRPLTDIYTLLRQALVMAEQKQLLRIQRTSSAPAQHARSLALKALVPRHTMDAAGNPLTLTIAIRDKNARNLYLAIDDHKTIAELASLTQLSKDEMSQALRVLLKQQRIQLYEPGPGGKSVDHRPILYQGRKDWHL
ncbi:hypothetical protein EPA93_28555 [Ktedonosporobacter rubrisoli]|uniref:Uncharacterized protein n=1 Tax=Ktedonosporobacter rubrisoli TaxID=2509675 RepID=A0A4P6JW66_KTERU|nr:hypothetical protein [Ktedonosporobacter rubrisoli]QBD79715.1 hypothetical protein EPA93_28555 [Ktedonosporobacter rubrisoli]